MSWIIYALGAMFAIGISDLFRKLGSNLKDALFTNLIFQLGSVTTAIILFLLFSRKIENNSQGIMYAVIGGILISLFSALSFKALNLGPGVSTVIPIMRVGGVLVVSALGVILFRDKLSWQLVVGIILACSGLYLIFSAQ